MIKMITQLILDLFPDSPSAKFEAHLLGGRGLLSIQHVTFAVLTDDSLLQGTGKGQGGACARPRQVQAGIGKKRQLAQGAATQAAALQGRTQQLLQEPWQFK